MHTTATTVQVNGGLWSWRIELLCQWGVVNGISSADQGDTKYLHQIKGVINVNEESFKQDFQGNGWKWEISISEKTLKSCLKERSWIIYFRKFFLTTCVHWQSLFLPLDVRQDNDEWIEEAIQVGVDGKPKSILNGDWWDPGINPLEDWFMRSMSSWSMDFEGNTDSSLQNAELTASSYKHLNEEIPGGHQVA